MKQLTNLQGNKKWNIFITMKEIELEIVSTQ